MAEPPRPDLSIDRLTIRVVARPESARTLAEAIGEALATQPWPADNLHHDRIRVRIARAQPAGSRGTAGLAVEVAERVAQEVSDHAVRTSTLDGDARGGPS
jgi:hypothetical protein